MIRTALTALADTSPQRHMSQAEAAVPAERSQLRDITGIETVPPTLGEPNPFWLWLAVAGFAVALVLVFVIWRRRSRIAAEPRPHVRALESLSLLAEGKLELNSGRLHEQIADILRGYIRQRFDIPASQRTSQELLEAMAAAHCGSIEHQKKLAALADRCDSAKFAGLEFSANDCQQSVSMAREFVMATS